MPHPAPWQQYLRPLRTRPSARTRLICIPAAGGAVSFYADWEACLPADVELWAVQLPGRQDRLGEAAPTDLLLAARNVARALQWITDLPHALFGHSMGALIAYESVRYMTVRHMPIPVELFVSGCSPPDLLRPRGENPSSDQHVVAALKRQGFTTDLLDQPDARALIIPTVRSDLRMFDSYAHSDGQLLTCPITALSGTHDPEAPVADAHGWSRHTTARVQTMHFDGNHSYLDAAFGEVAAAVSEILDTRLLSLNV